jgi:hypothetical protein
MCQQLLFLSFPAIITPITNIERAVERWRRTNIPLRPPFYQAAIEDAFSRIGRPCSADVARLYRVTGGMDEAIDSTGLYLWPLGKVISARREQAGEDVAFGDCLIDCFRFDFHFEDVERSSVFGGYERRRLADSVEDFFDTYLRDPGKLDLMD